MAPVDQPHGDTSVAAKRINKLVTKRIRVILFMNVPARIHVSLPFHS